MEFEKIVLKINFEKLKKIQDFNIDKWTKMF